MAPEAEIHFQRIAVTPEQIQALGLPTRPTKRSDTRSKGFDGDSVEVDAIPAPILRQLVRDCIERHVDGDQLERLLLVEEAERTTLSQVVAGLNGTRP